MNSISLVADVGVGVGDGVLAVGKIEAGLDAGREADGGDVQGEVHGEVGAQASLPASSRSRCRR